MAGDIITLPIRLGVRATSLALRAGEAVVTRTLSLALRASGVAGSNAGSDFAPQTSRFETEGKPEPGRDANGAVEPALDEPRPRAPGTEPSPSPRPRPEIVIDLDAPPSEEPTHVSEEPTPVGEFSEPGAEDGAGAQLTVDEPWPGYTDMNARDVIAALDGADSAQLAAVQLFETTHQARQTVLSAVERQLRLATRERQ